MIRPTDLPQTSTWLRPSLATQPRATAFDASDWRAEPGEVESSISADPHPSARGLSVEQHTRRVLMHLTEREN